MKWYHWCLVGALAAAGAFAVGRCTAPARPAEVRVEEKIEWRDRVVEKRVEVASAVRTTVVYRDRVVKPDGTRIEREVERTDASAVVDTATQRVEQQEATGTTKTHTEFVELRSTWRVGVLAGVGLPKVAPVYGAVVERRVIGGLSAGAWGLSGGAVGLTVSYEF